MDTPAAVLFDLDGTLIDSHGLWLDGDRHVLAQRGYVLSEQQWAQALEHLDGSAGVRTYIRRLCELAGAEIDEDWFHAQVEAYVTPRLARAPWMPGAQELLFEVDRRGIPTGLVTNVKRAGVHAWLEGLEEDPFDAVVAGDEVALGKPHPEPYLKAASMLGVEPEKCVAVEDSVGGYASADAAGCIVVLVSRGRHAVDGWVPSLERPKAWRLCGVR